MSIYVGMDLHSDNVMLGWMDAEGKRLKHQRLPNDIDLILSCLEPYMDQIVAAQFYFCKMIHLAKRG